jgi:hypothetical protein
MTRDGLFDLDADASLAMLSLAVAISDLFAGSCGIERESLMLAGGEGSIGAWTFSRRMFTPWEEAPLPLSSRLDPEEADR